jgi:hypothetical protein
MRKISRQTAKARGLKRYFTGNPCPRGHVAERWVSVASCVRCGIEKAKEWRDQNPDKVAIKNAQFRAAHPGYTVQWQRDNREKARRIWRRFTRRKYGWSPRISD